MYEALRSFVCKGRSDAGYVPYYIIITAVPIVLHSSDSDSGIFNWQPNIDTNIQNIQYNIYYYLEFILYHVEVQCSRMTARRLPATPILLRYS